MRALAAIGQGRLLRQAVRAANGPSGFGAAPLGAHPQPTQREARQIEPRRREIEDARRKLVIEVFLLALKLALQHLALALQSGLFVLAERSCSVRQTSLYILYLPLHVVELGRAWHLHLLRPAHGCSRPGGALLHPAVVRARP